MTVKCSGCHKEIRGISPTGHPESDTLWLHAGPKMICAICVDCQKGVLVAKLILTRETGREHFNFERLTPASCERAPDVVEPEAA